MAYIIIRDVYKMYFIPLRVLARSPYPIMTIKQDALV
jgi:hypothetical protein